MTENLLENTWKGICKQNDAIDLIGNFWIQIQKAYNSKGRYYHNLNHIGNIIESSTIYKDKIEDLETVQLAAFYHDIVYSAKRNDNEEQSAKLAALHLKKLNYPILHIEKCCNYILATKGHSNAQNDNDLKYFLDFDLQKLGSSWDQYAEYSRQIRLEYRFYPDIIYKPGRIKVLEHFLKLERIFKSPEFFDLYERQARSNLLKELELLG